jgi:glycosyltransferase involved in cell wall biosynthesis
MQLLFVSNYFPPEVNAPATRTYEHAKQWVEDGHDVEILTAVPNFPEGEVYDGYENQFYREEIEGIDVIRVPMYVTENSGIVRRSLSYLSFMLSAIAFCGRLRRAPDLVAATSPQFFCAVAGYLISLLYRVPFVMEVRDLWPESIVAVGAMERNAVIRGLEIMERFLYRQAAHIIVVTEAFREAISQKGIPEKKISVLKNGIDVEAFPTDLDQEALAEIDDEYGLRGKFVASYIGTIGMAHRADVLFEAAQRCEREDVVFMVVGGGAVREQLEERQADAQLPNFRLVEKQPKDKVPYFLGVSDVSVVHLKNSPLFETVIPSKIFESMAAGNPIVHGVRGESKELIEEAGAGIPVPPEDADAIVEAVTRLKDDTTLYQQMSRSAREYVRKNHDRSGLARRYWALLETVERKQEAVATR